MAYPLRRLRPNSSFLTRHTIVWLVDGRTVVAIWQSARDAIFLMLVIVSAD